MIMHQGIAGDSQASQSVPERERERMPRVQEITDQIFKHLARHQEQLQRLWHKLEPIRLPKPTAATQSEHSSDIEDEGPSHIRRLEHLARMIEEQSTFVTRLIEEVEL